MSKPVTFVALGGDHANESWARDTFQMARQLKEAGVPVTLAVENSNFIDSAEKMVAHKAQMLVELQIASGGIEIVGGQSVEDTVVAKAKELYQVDLAPGKLDLAVLNSDGTRRNPDDPLYKSLDSRIGAYTQELELYQWAAQNDVGVQGIETQESRRIAEQASDPLKGEVQRLKQMTDSILQVVEAQMEKGGVVLTADLGRAHAATLTRALTARVAQKAMVPDSPWHEVKIASLSGMQNNSLEETHDSHLRGALGLTSSAKRAGDEFHQNIGKIAEFQIREKYLPDHKRVQERQRLRDAPEKVKALKQELNELQTDLNRQQAEVAEDQEIENELDALIDEMEAVNHPDLQEALRKIADVSARRNELQRAMKEPLEREERLQKVLAKWESSFVKAQEMESLSLETFEQAQKDYLLMEEVVAPGELVQHIDAVGKRHTAASLALPVVLPEPDSMEPQPPSPRKVKEDVDEGTDLAAKLQQKLKNFCGSPSNEPADGGAELQQGQAVVTRKRSHSAPSSFK